jgi:fructose-bisphosphate aldolase, class II
MLATLKQLLTKAKKEHYAVGAFNVNNLEILEAVIRAAENLNSSVIIQTSEGALQYAGFEELANMCLFSAKKAKVKVCLHLDHGKDFNTIKKCIKAGYTSVMIDGSHFEFSENVKITKKVVSFANKKGVSVEGELGTIGGVEDLVSSRKIIYTDPSAAKEFVEKTGIDALAIAIGTSHGAYKFMGKAKLDIARLQRINKIVKVPLVLHGASSVPRWLVEAAERYGAQLGSPEGVPEQQIAQAIKHGICKVNTDTDLRIAFTAAERKYLAEHKEEFDPRKVLGSARELMQKVVEERIRLFGSCGKSKTTKL